ncbi:MAG: hypothetical protein ACR2H9_04730 [Longimicrobiaceae bacterium]
MSLHRLAIVCLVLLAACATAPNQSAGRASAGNAPITEAELYDSSANDLYTAIQMLRPRWLRVQQVATNSSSNLLVVYYGQSRLGGPESLRGVAIGDVRLVTFLRPPEAQLRFGNNHTSGAIVLEPAVH